MKKITALTLVISLFVSMLTVYAEESKPQIDINNRVSKNEVKIDNSQIPIMDYKDSYRVNLSEDNISLLSESALPTESEAGVIPEFEVTDTLVIPSNKIELDEGGWVSSNEVDEDDIYEEVRQFGACNIVR